jgi:hypothetical protein
MIQNTANRWIRHAWFTAVAHAVGSTLILLTTGVNIVLAAHYPVVSAAAILGLGYGMRRGSRAAALLLVVAVASPAAVKLAVGALHPADLPAFPLAILYARGLWGAIRVNARS